MTITDREAARVLDLYLRGLDAGNRALVARANAALCAYLAQFAGEAQRAKVRWLCARVWAREGAM